MTLQTRRPSQILLELDLSHFAVSDRMNDTAFNEKLHCEKFFSLLLRLFPTKINTLSLDFLYVKVRRLYVTLLGISENNRNVLCKTTDKKQNCLSRILWKIFRSTDYLKIWIKFRIGGKIVRKLPLA